MAYSMEQWNRAKFLFEMGWSLRDIENDCGISNGQISKRAKKEAWEKSPAKQAIKDEIVDFEREKEAKRKQKEALVRKTALSFSDFEVTILDELVTNEANIKSLITSTQTVAMIRANELLSRGKKTTLMKVGQYDSKGNRSGETYEPFETDLDASDIRTTIEAVDKASITLGINQRHANVNISNTNAQQNNVTEQKTVVFKRIEKVE